MGLKFRIILILAILSVITSCQSINLNSNIDIASKNERSLPNLLFPSLSPESYVDQFAIWKRERYPIPVCWEEASKDQYKKEKSWVEDAIKKVIEDVSSVRFSGNRADHQRWQDCTKASMGIRITIADLQPKSEVGQQWRKIGTDAKVEVPTHMRLNFQLGGVYEQFCKLQKKHCIQVIAVHEFLHAIGFLHEHLRSDAPDDCKKRFEHAPDVYGYNPINPAAKNRTPMQHKLSA